MYQIGRFSGTTPETRCEPCEVPHEGYFNGKDIVICGNYVSRPQTIERVIKHELIHAFDFSRTEFDTNDCSHIACTEVTKFLNHFKL